MYPYHRVLPDSIRTLRYEFGCRYIVNRFREIHVRLVIKKGQEGIGRIPAAAASVELFIRTRVYAVAVDTENVCVCPLSRSVE
jgi:hypothetical protein